MISAQDQYHHMQRILNEKQWRQYLATEAQVRNNLAFVTRNAQVSENTIRRGVAEIAAGNLYHPGDRVRAPGAGAKRRVDVDPTLKTDLEALLEPKGDPMSLVRWTTKSLANLVASIKAKGHHLEKSALHNYLVAEGFSLKAAKKNIEGKNHPDRDLQFHYLKGQCQSFESRGCPMISIDCKKKELIGNFKNQGKDWQPKGKGTVVNVYDYTDRL